MSSPNPDTFRSDLLSLPQQVTALREINRYYWDNYFSADQLNAIPTSARSIQRLGLVTSLHVEFDSPVQTLLMWRNAYFRHQWTSAHWNMMAIGNENGGEEYLRLHESTKRYEPGIHVVHADLTYRFGDQANIDTVRAEAMQEGHYLAHGELLSIVGLHKALRQPEEKRASYLWSYNPYLAGYENNDPYYTQQSPNYAWRWVPRFDTGSHRGEVGLRVFMASAARYGSVPRILSTTE